MEPAIQGMREARAKRARLQGVGAMWYTNLEFGGEATGSIDYKLLLPFISLEPCKVAAELRPTGRLTG